MKGMEVYVSQGTSGPVDSELVYVQVTSTRVDEFRADIENSLLAFWLDWFYRPKSLQVALATDRDARE